MRTATRAFMVVLMPVPMRLPTPALMLLPLPAPTSGLVLLPLPASTSGLVRLPLKVPTPALMLLPLPAPTSGLVLLPLPASTSGLVRLPLKVPTPTLVLLPPKVPTPTLVLLPPKVPTPTLVLLPLLAPTPALMPLPLLAPTPALMPLPLKVPTLVPRRTPIKMAMLRIIDSIQSPTLTKESYKRKGSQMVLLERKKLKAQFPNTSENMNVLQFLGFRSDEIKHLFLYGIDVYFCPEGVFTQYGLCKGCQKMFGLCVCWAGQKVSYRRMAWEALAVERMLRNDEEYKEYLEDIEPYHGDPVGYLKFFSVKRREIYSQIQRNYAWYLAITRRRETISVLDSTRGKQGSQVFRMSGRQIKELYYKVWSNLRESKTEVLQYFLNWDEKKCQEEWEAKDDTVFVEALEKVGVFQRLRSMTSAGLQGPQYVKLQFSRHHRQLRSRYELSLGMHLRDQLALGVTPSKVPHWTAFLSMLIGLFCNKTFRQKLEYLLEQISEVWLLPHWLDLANVEVLAADNTRVPLYMLMVAVHKELDSDDVPDGRFDIILLCRDSSREVGE
ncbi:BLD_1a_G0016420.mRNA.1.CDS.1 [Saccharomyces cerevisiae]|nr:BLD_1a_G0016420.mRNA.1.CDS.1 [Saccharomyces cerevisiae]CAI7106029.1 BLD_1a_G0016420.mRNA.1.CDS.1 [Saccharomyces cerevisiae]